MDTIDDNGGGHVNGFDTKAAGSNVFQLDELSRLANGDEKFVTEMISLYISNAQEEEAKIKKDLLSESWEALADHAHSIAPPSRHIGALPVFRLLIDIEDTARNNPDKNRLSAMVEELESKFAELIPQLESELKKRNSKNL